MIKVLIVDDSKIVREFLIYILNSDPQLRVIDTAVNGKEAISKVMQLKPDVVLMDIHMPIMDGFEATQKIMETSPVPIIIVSGSIKDDDTYLSFKAIKAGALVVVKKPLGLNRTGQDMEVKELIKYVKLMSEIKVATRWRSTQPQNQPLTQNITNKKHLYNKMKIIAIGASTGGPAIIEQILSSLPQNLPVPILVVQHMATGFIDSYVKWLGMKITFPVKLAKHGEHLVAGTVYFAPDGYHILVGINDCIVLSRENPHNGLRPTVARLFHSVAEIYGHNAIGVLLTGMGHDGAEELKLMRDAGAVTIVQDMKSCIVFGMPHEAIKLDAAEFVLDPTQIAEMITRLVN